jgi:hypothetical protein
MRRRGKGVARIDRPLGAAGSRMPMDSEVTPDPVIYQDGPIHTWFGLSYASYLVLPRLVLDAMPQEWQGRFVGLLGELDDRYGYVLDRGTYSVQLKDDAGRFQHDPLSDYRHGRIPPSEAATHDH